MGRIVTHVTIANILDRDKSISCDALVDTGAAHMVLPKAWQQGLGKFDLVREVTVETATQERVNAQVCGPFEIHIEGFAPVSGEVLFLDMSPVDGKYEPLVGYIVLESCEAAVDMLGHRLVHVNKTDLK